MEATLRDLSPSWRNWLLSVVLLVFLLLGVGTAVYAAGGMTPLRDVAHRRRRQLPLHPLRRSMRTSSASAPVYPARSAFALYHRRLA